MVLHQKLFDNKIRKFDLVVILFCVTVTRLHEREDG